MPVGRKQVQAKPTLVVLDLVFKTGLLGDVGNEVGIEFEQEEFVIAGQQHLHEFLFYLIRERVRCRALVKLIKTSIE